MTEFEITLYFVSGLHNKLRSPPLFWRKKFERHFSDIMDFGPSPDMDLIAWLDYMNGAKKLAGTWNEAAGEKGKILQNQ